MSIPPPPRLLSQFSFFLIGDAGDVDNDSRVPQAAQRMADMTSQQQQQSEAQTSSPVRQRQQDQGANNNNNNNNSNSNTAAIGGDLRFIASLGDNFYPEGLRGVDDRQFARVWRNVFPDAHHQLRVPTQVLLGNHDYMSTEIGVNAQLALSFPRGQNVSPQQQNNQHENDQQERQNENSSSSNSSFWRMCGDDGVPRKCYKKRELLHCDSVDDAPPIAIDFFFFDSNASQFCCRRDCPSILDEYYMNRAWLKAALEESDAVFKVLLTHQPMYTKGLMHGVVGDCLRSRRYKFRKRGGRIVGGVVAGENSNDNNDNNNDNNSNNEEVIECDGLALEDVIDRPGTEDGVDFVMSGHEHVLQFYAKENQNDEKRRNDNSNSTLPVFHCCFGASIESYFYVAEDTNRPITWMGGGVPGFGRGVVSVEMMMRSEALRRGAVAFLRRRAQPQQQAAAGGGAAATAAATPVAEGGGGGGTDDAGVIDAGGQEANDDYMVRVVRFQVEYVDTEYGVVVKTIEKLKIIS